MYSATRYGSAPTGLADFTLRRNRTHYRIVSKGINTPYTEATFLIWKLRCKCVIDRPDHEPERLISQTKATSTLTQILNERLRDDRAMTNHRKHKSKALRRKYVLETWSRILLDESALPVDWICRILVGTTPHRLNGTNR